MNDLVIVYPMKSRTGYIQYLKFTAGVNKGGVAQGDVFNDVFKMGAMTDGRINYTSALVPETVKIADDGTGTVSFFPIRSIQLVGADSGVTVEIVDAATGKIKVTGATGDVKVAYIYDNVQIPQNTIPTLVANMEGIELAASARRIAVYYSQMAAFQAKTEMGIDLGEVLATQACAELSYEIDTEVVKLLADSAKEYDDLTFNKRLPVGVSKRDHYAGFAEIIELGSQHIYDRTQKHAANYVIASSSLKPLLVMMDGFKAASTAKINGPYYAGELNGLKVYISPAIEAGKFVLGYNGGDMLTSAAVYAPYMAIVPTALLNFADGAYSQGFSTLYDLKLLNDCLLCAGKVVDTDFVSGVITNTL